MRKRIIKTIIILIAFGLGLGLFAILIWHEGIGSILNTLMSFGFLPFIGFLCISLINFSLYSWRWQLILNHQIHKSKRISFFRMYQHRLAGFAAGYITPAAQVAGEPARIGMLMSDGIASREATSAVTLDTAIELVAYISFMVMGVVMAVVSGLVASTGMIWIGAALVFALLLLLVFLFGLTRGRGWFSIAFNFFRLDKVSSLEKVGIWIKETENLMGLFLKSSRSFLAIIMFIAMVAISFRIVEVFYLAHFFGASLTFAQAFLSATLPGIALLLPVPGGLGLFEGGFTSLFLILHIPLSAIAFALIIRLRDIIFISLGLIHLLRQGGSLLQNILKGQGYGAKHN